MGNGRCIHPANIGKYCASLSVIFLSNVPWRSTHLSVYSSRLLWGEPFYNVILSQLLRLRYSIHFVLGFYDGLAVDARSQLLP